MKSKSVETCNILLKNGAKGDKKDLQGRTPLHTVMEPMIDNTVCRLYLDSVGVGATQGLFVDSVKSLSSLWLITSDSSCLETLDSSKMTYFLLQYSGIITLF